MDPPPVAIVLDGFRELRQPCAQDCHFDAVQHELHSASGRQRWRSKRAGEAPLEPAEKPRVTQVVATLGPASWTEEMVPEMMKAGVNIFRMNCSHRRGGVFEEVYPRLRKYSAALNIPIQILGDLQGPKVRSGELKDDKPVELPATSADENGIPQPEETPEDLGAVATG